MEYRSTALPARAAFPAATPETTAAKRRMSTILMEALNWLAARSTVNCSILIFPCARWSRRWLGVLRGCRKGTREQGCAGDLLYDRGLLHRRWMRCYCQLGRTCSKNSKCSTCGGLWEGGRKEWFVVKQGLSEQFLCFVDTTFFNRSDLVKSVIHVISTLKRLNSLC